MSQEPIQHINYAISARTHTPMYLMHKYWARKPHNVVAEYIKHYSQEGEFVLDPFVGSGVTVIESLKLGRKAIGTDLDPMSTFITRMSILPIDLDEFKEQFTKIKKKVKTATDSLYKMRCSNCNRTTIADAFIWKDNKPTLIRYKCKCSKGTLWRKVTGSYLKRIKKIEKKVFRFGILKRN